MKSTNLRHRTQLALLICCLCIISACENSLLASGSYSYDPDRFDADIRQFEESDSKSFPAKSGILFLGSSSIRQWGPYLMSDMAPLSVIPRGFGGSNMNDALYYTDRIVLPYKPRAIVLYEGENDIDQGVSPKTIALTYKSFVEKVRVELPDCRIYFISIKPTPARWRMWSKMVEANNLIRQLVEMDDNQFYVDVADAMLNSNGEPKDNIYLGDGIHMTRDGYRIWMDALLPVLMKNELSYDK